ncbi:MAG TPA: fumarylacetoacetate hydrolase family protein [Steroidobacteraceae bacterium]|nr:fumarylacetoacetate hydrolase family protein [Steroidobacteraceae bacterium]
MPGPSVDAIRVRACAEPVGRGDRRGWPLSREPRLLRRPKLRRARPRDGGTSRPGATVLLHETGSALLADHEDLPYPTRTRNLHYEAELVVAIGTAGRNVPLSAALAHVYGYAVGNDYTRRDLQAAARDKRHPWEIAKAFDHSAAIGSIHPTVRIGHPQRAAIWLTVNGVEKQRADIADMIWDVPGVIAELSTLFDLQPGDLIYTGTPAGVGPVSPGDVVVAGIDGLGTLTNTIAAGHVLEGGG